MSTVANIAGELKKERIGRRWKQSDLAEKMQCSQSWVSVMESGSASLTVRQVSDWAEAFDKKVVFSLVPIAD